MKMKQRNSWYKYILILVLLFIIKPGFAQEFDWKKIDKEADVLLKQQAFSQARKKWLQCLAYQPQNTKIINKIGITYTLEKSFDSAKKTFDKALTLEPNNPFTLFNLGLLSLHQDKPAECINWLKRTLQECDWYPEAHYHIGVALEELGKPKEAMQQYVQELNVNPRSAKAWVRLQKLEKIHGKLIDRSRPLSIWWWLVLLTLALGVCFGYRKWVESGAWEKSQTDIWGSPIQKDDKNDNIEAEKKDLLTKSVKNA